MSTRIFALMSTALLVLLTASCAVMTTDQYDEGAIAQKAPGELVYYVFTNVPGEESIQVQALNSKDTLCANGEVEPYCEFEEFDYTHADLSEDTIAQFEYYFSQREALARGWLEYGPADDGKIGLVPTLYVDEAWLDVTPGTLDHGVYSVGALDIQCVRAPCPEYQARLLNGSDEPLLHRVVLETSEASDEVVNQAYRLMKTGDILISGEVTAYTVDEDAEFALAPYPGQRTLEADTFYFQLTE